MKILITTFTYLPNKDGVSEACRVLAEGLAQRGWDVWVATSMGNEFPDIETPSREVNGVKIIDFNVYHDSLSSASLKNKITNYHNFILSGNFDILVSQCWDVKMTLLLQPILASLPLRHVMVSHGYGRHIYSWQPCLTMGVFQWLKGIIFTIFNLTKMILTYDCLIFLSKQKDFGRFFDHTLASWMRPKGIHFVENSIHLDQFPESGESFRKEFDLGTSSVVLCVANYSDRKNQQLAVKAFRKANVPDSVLVCIGSDMNGYANMLVTLDNRLKDFSPNCRVVFLEKISREQTFAAFSACDVVILSAKFETQPIVLIEAMAAGKPWISTNTGCVATMQGGIVCRGKSELTSALRRLLSSAHDRNLLALQGKQEALANHDREKNITRFDKILKELHEASLS